jgi:hypothetical protein
LRNTQHWKNYQALIKLQKELKSSFVQEHKIKNREEFLAINEEFKQYKRRVRGLKSIEKRIRVSNLKQLELNRKIRIKRMDIIFKNPEMRSLQKVNMGMSM